eukprot:TRINITY_DN8354_c0_g1_i1.p1 TRINITY_DN8354_c0_g1~~TRINITY_DN8354_c0_g1_i1.p1  ORF type:complete len:304 (+),score=98.36 TRINITY_DN8354_c0_g1_i1:76-987(+)
MLLEGCAVVLALLCAALLAIAAIHRTLDRNPALPAILADIASHSECVLITGGSSGLGLEFAERFCRRGFQVVLVARNRSRLDLAIQKLSPLAALPPLALSCDLSLPNAVHEHVLPFLEHHSLHVGVLVNNAGLGYAGHLHLQDPRHLSALVTLNCTAPAELSCALARPMAERRRGVLINLSSVSAYQPLPTHAAYAASKAFLSTLSFSQWDELRSHRVHVLAVEPGTVNTGFAEAAGQAPHHGASAVEVVDDAMRALDEGRASTVFGWYVWLRACVAALLPRSIVAPIARMKMEPLDMNTKQK